MKIVGKNSVEAQNIKWKKNLDKVMKLTKFRLSSEYKELSTVEQIILENRIWKDDNNRRVK